MPGRTYEVESWRLDVIATFETVKRWATPCRSEVEARKFVMNNNWKSRAVRALLRAPIYVYRCGGGRLLGKRFLLLTHVGRRTGRRYQNVLEVVRYRQPGPEVVVMSGFGPHANWFLNIQATSFAEINVGAKRFVANHRFLDPQEAAEAFKNYERRNRFIAPVVRYVLSRLVGWRYHGSDIERKRLVTELPLVAFYPQSAATQNVA